MNLTPSIPMNSETSNFCSFTGDQSGVVYTEQKFTCIALHKFISQVIIGLRSRADERSNIMINDVLPAMLASTDKQILTPIIHSLLDVIVTNSRDNSIYISAKLIGSITLIHVRSSDAAYSDPIIAGLQKIELLAESLGGCLTVSNNKMYGLTLAFTFINH